MDNITVVARNPPKPVDKLNGKPVQIVVDNGDLWALTNKGNIYIRLVGGKWQEIYTQKTKAKK